MDNIAGAPPPPAPPRGTNDTGRPNMSGLPSGAAGNRPPAEPGVHFHTINGITMRNTTLNHGVNHHESQRNEARGDFTSSRHFCLSQNRQNTRTLLRTYGIGTSTKNAKKILVFVIGMLVPKLE